jgi:hypothetical protein
MRKIFGRSTGRHAVRTSLASQLVPWWLMKVLAPLMNARLELPGSIYA